MVLFNILEDIRPFHNQNFVRCIFMNIGLNRKTIYVASRRPNVSIWMYKLCKSPPYREQHISNHHRDLIQVQIVPVY